LRLSEQPRVLHCHRDLIAEEGEEPFVLLGKCAKAGAHQRENAQQAIFVFNR
jgi:hypothetical protein